ncbi:hypothetical protein [Sphingopyxis sp. 550A]
MAPENHPSGKWWRRGTRSRYHSYYHPATNRQGRLLFCLIAMLGLAALGFTAFHMLRQHALSHDDRVLGTIGIACVLLGVWQIRTLSR